MLVKQILRHSAGFGCAVKDFGDVRGNAEQKKKIVRKQ